jgi:hypothetical protein
MEHVPSPPRLPAWLLERLLPAPVLEHALGDLAEEYGLRAGAGSESGARQWYWTQIVRSFPILFRQSLRNAGVLQTLAVAVAFQFAAGVAESLAIGGIGVLQLGDVARAVVSVIIGIGASGCAGYFAARMRRPAATVMGAMVLAIVVMLMLTRGDAAPLWYQLVFLIAGPIAPIAGGTIASRHQLRRIH